MAIVQLRDQSKEVKLVGVEAFRSGNSGNGLRKYLKPILSDDVSVGRPVFDDVPKSKERKQLISRIGKFNLWVAQFVLKGRIAYSRYQRDVKLLAGQPIVTNRHETLAELRPEGCDIANPIEIGPKFKLCLIQFAARITWIDWSQRLDPMRYCGICTFVIASFENLGQYPKEVIVPLATAGRYGRVVVLQKPPNSSKYYKIIDLNVGQLTHRHPRTAVELVICFKNRFWAIRFGSFPYGPVIHQ